MTAPRHGNGSEIISQSQTRSSIPEHITDDTKLLAFRFYGKAPMAGYREERIFCVIWLDRDFTLYEHR